jgi:hypothetical protein
MEGEMSRLFRCLVILLLVFLSACDLIEDSFRTIMDFVSPDVADTGSPSAYISPYSGPIGTVYSIYFSSFPAGQLVEICSSFLQTGEVLLCWQTEADEVGNGSGGLMI